MKNLLKFIAPALAILFWGISLSFPALAAQESYICLVYFTGIGCPHCEMTAPLLLEQLPREYPNLVVIEYEIYGEEQNTVVFDKYVSTYHTEYKIPTVVFGQDRYLTSHQPITSSIRAIIEGLDSNACPLSDGSSQDFSDLALNSLAGYPTIWHQDRVLIKTGPQGDDELLKDLLTAGDPAEVLRDTQFEAVEPAEVVIPGGKVKFDNAISIDDWIFQWNGESIEVPPEPSPEPEPIPEPVPEPEPTPPPPPTKPTITLPKVLSLAVADAVNPCAFAVLLLMLVSIIAYNPGNRRSILYAGAAFITSVFIMYFLYGLLFIKFFQVVQALSAARFWLFRALAVAAIVFGTLNIRDFARYKPGGIGTEMPLFMRPRLKKIMSGITSTKGAFITGLVVTVFLLPCTIGPYIIAAGILSVFDLLETVPVLALYNLVFIIPLIAIVAGVYLGTGRVHDFYLWKERHITKLHLVAGIIILGLGIYMLLESLGIVLFLGMA